MGLALPTVDDQRTQQALDAISNSFPLHTQLLVDEVITVDKIVDGTITGQKIAAGTIEGSNIVAGTIEGTHIKAGTISAVAIEAEAIETKHLKAEAVTAAKIKANTIEAGQIKAGTITATEIKANSITANELSIEKLSSITANLGTITAGTITSATIKTAAAGARVEMDGEGIRGINAAAVKKFEFSTATGILTATAVISSEEGSVIPTKHLAGQIKETQIEPEAIATPLLAANAVTADKISVSKLSAITADLGTITAGTITGVTFQTSTGNPKVIMDAEGFRALDSGGNVVVDIPSDGSTARFIGKLEPRGIVIEEGSVGAASILWNFAGTENEASLLSVDHSGATTAGIWRARAKAAGEGSKLDLEALDSTVSTGAGVNVRHSSTAAERYVRAAVSGGSTITVMDGAGSSSLPRLTELANRTIDLKGGNVTLLGTGSISNFLQLPEALKRRVVYGTVTSAGVKTAGEGYTVKKNAAGNYTVTFSSEMSIVPAATATPNTTAIIPQFTCANVAKTGFDVRIWNGGVATDCAFSFVAVG